MGFLKGLLGGASGRVPKSHGVTLDTSYFARIRDNAQVQVVGEHYRQGQVRLARPPGPSDLPPGVPPPPPGYYKAMLIPEPTNQYDRNAIAVHMWAGRSWSLGGYLSRDDAASYQAVFRHLAAVSRTGSPPAIACDAALVPERSEVGIVLHFGTPGECIVELATDDRTPSGHPWAAKAVVFSGHGVTTIYGVPLDREAQIMLARWAGCDVLPRLTKKTGALIVADPNEVTSNLQKAKEYGVPVVDEPSFVAGVGIPAETIGRLTQRWARV